MAAIIARVAIGRYAAAGGVHKNAPILSLLRIPPFAAMFLSFLGVFFVSIGMEAIWQPWLGTSGENSYGWTPAKISVLGVCIVVSMGVSSATLGVAMCMYVGNLLTCLVGNIVVIGALLFIGSGSNPPLLFPFVRPQPWLPYVIICTLGFGMGLIMVSFTPIVIEILSKESNLTRKETDGTLAGIMVTLPMISLVFGPSVCGAVIEHLGAAGAAMLCAGVLLTGVVLQLIFVRDYFGVKESPQA